MPRHARAAAAAQLDAELTANFGKQAPQPQPAPAPQTVAAPPPTGRIDLPPPNPAPSQPPVPDGEGEATLKQRISTLGGMLKAAQRTNDELIEKIAQLEAQLQAAPPAAAAPPALLDYFSQEDIDELGEDYCKRQLGAMLRLEQRTANLTAKAVEKAVAPLQAKVAESNKNDLARKSEAFFGELNRLVPGWEAWAVGDDCDPRFSAWLTETISPYSRETRETVLHAAQKRFDSTVVVSLLHDFLKSLGVDPAPNRNPVERLLPVGNSGGGGDPPPRSPKADTRMAKSEIDRFASDFGKGRYKGRAKEALEIQKRIDAAYLSNNIDPNR